MKELNGPSLLPKSGKVERIVILLHGFGADGEDLIGLAPYLAPKLPNTAFFAPNGPDICEISPFGRQWFSLARCDGDYLRRRSETQATAFEAMYEEAVEASPIILDYIQKLQNLYNLPASKVALVGFSQGTMMSLHIGLRQSEPFACVVGFSGALVGASKLKADMTCTCPIQLIHGEADEMLPIHAVELAKQGLKDAGVPVDVMRRPNLPHSIDQEGLEAAGHFLQSHL